MSQRLSISHGPSTLEFEPRTALLCQWHFKDKSGLSRQVFYEPFQQESAIPHWPGGGCPMLFPWAGRVWLGNDMGQYTWQNRSAAMPIHGFVYVAEYHLVEHSPSEIEFSMKTNALTRTAYPWDFSVRFNYKIMDGKLSVSMTIQNLDTVDLGFAPGIHPFFKLDGMQDWKVQIPAHTAYEVTAQGLAGKSRPIAIDGMPCVSPELRSVILGNLSQTHADLIHADPAHRIRIGWDAKTSRYIVLWVDKQAGYFCLEPWSGQPDAIHNGHGLEILKPREERRFSYQLEVG
jgi:galactose mutarotase-like enzyme